MTTDSKAVLLDVGTNGEANIREERCRPIATPPKRVKAEDLASHNICARCKSFDWKAMLGPHQQENDNTRPSQWVAPQKIARVCLFGFHMQSLLTNINASRSWRERYGYD